MLSLDKALAAWGTPGFESVLKEELARHADALPLQQALAYGSAVGEAPVTVMVESAVELEHAIRVKAGIFFQGVTRDCSCVDDPTPEGESAEYCELLIDIDKASAAATITLIDE